MKQRKRKRFWVIKPVNVFLMVLCILLCVPLYFYNQLAFYIIAPVTLLAVVFSGYRMWRVQYDLNKMVTGTGRSLTDTHEGSLINFTFPSIII